MGREIISGSLSLPDNFEIWVNRKIDLLAGSCTVPDTEFYWETGGVGTRELRRVFSQRTCNGCHARDTDTDFCHIRPRLAGEQSELSKFLRLSYDGYKIQDPGEAFKDVRSTAMRDRVEDFFKSLQAGGTQDDVGHITKIPLQPERAPTRVSDILSQLRQNI